MKCKNDKLNIGCAEYGMEGYVNIDNGFDKEGEIVNLMDFWKTEEENKGLEFFVMNGNDMLFSDERFNEVRSNQCVGKYVSNINEVLRVLKVGGKVKIGLWIDELGTFVVELLRRNIRIDKIRKFNFYVDDVSKEPVMSMDRDGSSTVMIEGTKMKNNNDDDLWY